MLTLVFSEVFDGDLLSCHDLRTIPVSMASVTGALATHHGLQKMRSFRKS